MDVLKLKKFIEKNKVPKYRLTQINQAVFSGRISSFLDINNDSRGANFQVQQALIAIGSGEMFGKGYGQSVQKFKYLPEPAGDSIFAVYAEEMGFVGAIVLILLCTFLRPFGRPIRI